MRDVTLFVRIDAMEYKDTLAFAKLDSSATMSEEENDKDGGGDGGSAAKDDPLPRVENTPRRSSMQVGTKEDVFTLEEGQARKVERSVTDKPENGEQ